MPFEVVNRCAAPPRNDSRRKSTRLHQNRDTKAFIIAPQPPFRLSLSFFAYSTEARLMNVYQKFRTMGFLSSLQDVHPELFYISSLAKSNSNLVPSRLPGMIPHRKMEKRWRSPDRSYMLRWTSQQKTQVGLCPKILLEISKTHPRGDCAFCQTIVIFFNRRMEARSLF